MIWITWLVHVSNHYTTLLRITHDVHTKVAVVMVNRTLCCQNKCSHAAFIRLRVVERGRKVTIITYYSRSSGHTGPIWIEQKLSSHWSHTGKHQICIKFRTVYECDPGLIWKKKKRKKREESRYCVIWNIRKVSIKLKGLKPLAACFSLLSHCSSFPSAFQVLTGRWCLCPGPRSWHQVEGRTDQSSASPLPQWMDRGRSIRLPMPGDRGEYMDTASGTGRSSEDEEDEDEGGSPVILHCGLALMTCWRMNLFCRVEFRNLQRPAPQWRWSALPAVTSGQGSYVQWQQTPTRWQHSPVQGSGAAWKIDHRYRKDKQ